MRIAIISPYVREPTPPVGWGPHLETVHTLAEGMLQRGHKVILYATGDSAFSGELRWRFERATHNPVHLSHEDRDYLEHNLWSFRDAIAEKVDVIHSHAPHRPMFMFQLGVGVPQVHTHHSVRDSSHVLTWASMRRHLDPSGSIADVCLSRAHARVCPRGVAYRVIYHGLEPGTFLPCSRGDGGYAATFSRIHPQKGIHHAIRAAQIAGMPLRIAGPLVDPRAKEYFDSAIKPHLSSQIQYVGTVQGRDEKIAFLTDASVLLNPICWEEPFGMSVLEAIFCGTPVISFPRGASREVIEEGVTGFFASNPHAMARSIPRALSLDRGRVRERGVERFSTERMLREYESLYASMASKRGTALPGAMRFVDSLESLDVVSWPQFVARLVHAGVMSRQCAVRAHAVLQLSKLLTAVFEQLRVWKWRLARLLGR